MCPTFVRRVLRGALRPGAGMRGSRHGRSGAGGGGRSAVHGHRRGPGVRAGARVPFTFSVTNHGDAPATQVVDTSRSDGQLVMPFRFFARFEDSGTIDPGETVVLRGELSTYAARVGVAELFIGVTAANDPSPDDNVPLRVTFAVSDEPSDLIGVIFRDYNGTARTTRARARPVPR